MRRRKMTHKARQAIARREREDAAPRLKDKVPTLEALRLGLTEQSAEQSLRDVVHARHVVVDVAPALFEIPCCDPDCENGGYDITTDVLHALRHEEDHFDGTLSCTGMRGDAACDRQLAFEGEASYGDAERDAA